MDKTYNDELYGGDNYIEELVTSSLEEQRGGQGIGTDRDGPVPTPPIDYAWAYSEKMSIPIPKKQGFDSSKNYYCEIESFAESIGFHMSQSNGIYTLRPCAPNPVSNDEEIANFKEKYPEYRNMKGTQARNKTNGIFNNYTCESGVIKLNNGFREKNMVFWLKQQVRWTNGTKQILKYLNKNSYRKLQKKTICKKFSWFDDTTLIQALIELGYLESSFNTKAKLCYQLTEKGREYVRSIN